MLSDVSYDVSLTPPSRRHEILLIVRFVPSGVTAAEPALDLIGGIQSSCKPSAFLSAAEVAPDVCKASSPPLYPTGI